MADSLERLLQIQAIDARLFRTRKELAAKPGELKAAEETVADCKQRLKQAEDALNTVQLDQKNREVELKGKEDHVRKLNGQLLTLKTNKEYQTMQREIEALKADNSLIEEAIIQAFDKVEEAAARKAKAQEALKAAEQNLDQEKTRIKKEQEEGEARIGQLERDRKTMLPDVDSETLELYDRLMRGRYGREKGRVLFQVQDETCTACHQRILPQTLNRLMMRTELVICDCGGAILYIPSEHE